MLRPASFGGSPGGVTDAFLRDASLDHSPGLVARPRDGFRLTVDVDRIEVDDRIIVSGWASPRHPAGVGPKT